MPYINQLLLDTAIRINEDASNSEGVDVTPPDDWDGETLHDSPANYAYNPYGVGTGDLRFTANERIEDYSPASWVTRSLSGGSGSGSMVNHQLATKLLRHRGDGGKYFFQLDMIYSGTNAMAININSDQAHYNSTINANDPKSLCFRSDGSGYDFGVYSAAPAWNTSWAYPDEVIVFIDFDNDLATISVNNVLQTSVDISDLSSDFVSWSLVLAATTNTGFRADPKFVLTTENVPTGTVIGDWVAWNDWDEWLTKNTPYYFSNVYTDWTFIEDLGGNNTISQGADGSVVFQDKIESPAITVLGTDTYALVVQLTHEAYPSPYTSTHQLEIEVRLNGASAFTTMSLFYDGSVIGNWYGCGIVAREFSATAGDEVTFEIRAANTFSQDWSIKNAYLVQKEPAPVGISQPPPPIVTPVTLDIDVASITETVAEGDTFTSATLTATPTNGSGQFTYLWTTDGEATINSPTSSTTTVSLTGSQETKSETITCTVTDTGDGGTTASDTCPIAITFGYAFDYVAYFEFEEDDIVGLVVEDLTSNLHDLTMENTIDAADGYDGLGIDLDGTQSGGIADDVDFKSTSFTYTGYHKRTGDGYVYQSGNYTGGLYEGQFVKINSNGSVAFTIGDGGAVQGTNWETVSTAAGVIPTGTYKMIGVTYDGANMRIFVDGLLVATKAATLTVTYPVTNYVTLGALNSSGTKSSYFLGNTDRVKIYDRALSSVEMLELHNLAHAPGTAPIPFGVTIDRASVGGIVFPYASPTTTQVATGTVAGGTGPFTYLWTEEAGGTGSWVINNPTSLSTSFELTSSSGEFETVFKLTVTDTGNGNITTSDTVLAFINNGAV